MIRLFIYILLALIIGAWLSVVVSEDPGYVQISFQGYSVESTLVAIVVAVVIIFILLLGILWILKLLNPLKLLKPEFRDRIFFRKNSRSSSEKGLQLLLLGHWQEAYKLLVENADRMQSPLFNYLAASFAAFQRGDRLAWTYCLSQAKNAGGSSIHGIKNLQALMELKSGRDEQALALLLALKKEAPDSPYVLKLLHDIYLKLNDWDKLEALLPELEKHRVLVADGLEFLHERLAVRHLRRAVDGGTGSTTLKKTWDGLPGKLQKNESVLAVYLQLLSGMNEPQEAVALLTRRLKQVWSDSFVEMLGRMAVEDVAPSILLLEGWIKKRPKSAVLMLTLGRLSLRNKLWGKAREYFETALKFSNDTRLSAEINAELARLLEHLGEHEKSLLHYRKAIGLTERALPELPMPNLH